MVSKPPDPHPALPTEAILQQTLGRAHAAWAQLHASLASDFGPLAEKWSFSGKTNRWSLQLKQIKKKRTVLYMIPCPGHFLAAFALGEKACRAAQASKLPPAMLTAIDRAPRFAEGRGVWLEVRNKTEVKSILTLAAIKMAN